MENTKRNTQAWGTPLPVGTGSCQRNEGDTREVGEAGAAGGAILWEILHLYLIGKEKVLILGKG